MGHPMRGEKLESDAYMTHVKGNREDAGNASSGTSF